MLCSILLCSLMVFGATGSQWPNVRIVDGTDVEPGEYPFMVSLQYNGRHACGATVVNECYILTAANCVAGNAPENYTAVFGTITWSSGGTKVDAAEITVHENYNPFDMYINDIAIVKLSSPISLDDAVQLVTLPEQNETTANHPTAILLGWGYPVTGGDLLDTLQQVELMVYSDEMCQNLHTNTIHETNICAGVSEGGKGQCTGDAGGPLLVNGTQVGIASWSMKPCAAAPYPGVFTEVSYYVDWISEKSNGTCVES
ncbi:chymotrypsin-1-like isoform X2 [Periplaneta americana]|uniref:chymotrypsin-1-like isoform X2 n=1 Tax=Periplaneta americana TaxID=6978 RepID=UPI0037E798D5